MRFTLARMASLATAALMIFAAPAMAQPPASGGDPAGGRLLNEPFVRITGDLQSHVLLPSFHGRYKLAPFDTNRWGMRDQDYELKPPKSTYRIALVGSSFTMAGGVDQPKTAEALLERKLNEAGPGAPRQNYEILNFSVGGYGVLNYLPLIDRRVLSFSPHAILLVIHSVDQFRLTQHLAVLVKAGRPLEYPYLVDKVAAVGAKAGMEDPELRRRLSPVAREILAWSYAHMVSESRRRGVTIVAIAFPEPTGRREEKLSVVAGIAAAAGIPVISLEGVYDGYDFNSVRLPRDAHLNELGNRLVADRLYSLLRTEDAKTLKLGFK